MKNVKKDLQQVSKSLRALGKKTEKLMKGVDKLEKAQAGGRPKAKAKTTTKTKPKTTTKTKPKTTTKTKPKTTTKLAAKKKGAVKETAAGLTATDQAVKIIKRSKKGLDVPTLKKKTGFEDKKIRNILNRASKQGKIKRTGRGIYVAA